MANKLFTATAIAVGLVAIPAVASADTQVRVFGGVSDLQDVDVDAGGYYSAYFAYEAQVEADAGFVVGAAVGLTHGNWVFEGELSHRSSDLSELQFPSPVYSREDIEGNISSTALLANAWYNIDAGNSWNFYVGGGVGIAEAEVEVSYATYYYGDVDASASEQGIAWQLGVGANYRTQSGFAYGVGYRYFNVTELGDTDFELTSHDFIFEVSRRF